MCHFKRVYYSCLHEDNDVTPPRELLYCHRATSSVNNKELRPCSPPRKLTLTPNDDFLAGVVRPGRCEACVQAADDADVPEGVDIDGTEFHSPGPASEISNGQGFHPYYSRARSPETPPRPSSPPNDPILAIDWYRDAVFYGDRSEAFAAEPREPKPARFLNHDNTEEMDVPSISNEINYDFQLFDEVEFELGEELQDIGRKVKDEEKLTGSWMILNDFRNFQISDSS
ncbi:hypothetical protein M426DRAFT_265313 [Hypoxylon sp. CI-4A]|nr:hypothetical protein M426DRAFT_265313 [Hypoxylon sp. CI-4A]